MLDQQSVVHRTPPAANDHRQTLELRVAQQLDGRKKSVHIEMSNTAYGFGGHGKAESIAPCTRP